MSKYDINNNPTLVKQIIAQEKKSYKEYIKANKQSLLPLFEHELRELGYEFEVLSQALAFLPKHKKVILPIAIRYYEKAKVKNEKGYFLSFFHFKGFEEVVPMLLEDYHSEEQIIDHWAISDCLYTIRSNKYINDYIKIISNPKHGLNRAMIILLVGKLKLPAALSILIHLLDNNDVRGHAIIALGNYKKENLRSYFKRFENSHNSFIRKCAKKALIKLNKASKFA